MTGDQLQPVDHDAETSVSRPHPPAPAPAAEDAPLATVCRAEVPLLSATFAPDGTRMITTLSEEPAVRVWDPAMAEGAATLHVGGDDRALTDLQRQAALALVLKRSCELRDQLDRS